MNLKWVLQKSAIESCCLLYVAIVVCHKHFKILQNKQIRWYYSDTSNRNKIKRFWQNHLPTCSYWDSFLSNLTFSSLIFLTSSLSVLFSFSKNAARNAIWFSLMRRASRDLFAAILFFDLLIQYFSSLQASGTKTWINS